MTLTTGPNPPIPTQDSDLSSQQLQAPQSITQADSAWMGASPNAAPASAPAAAPRPVTVGPGTPPITASSPNVKTHSFVARAASGLLTALAGEPGPVYSVDASGKLIASKAPPLTTGQKLARIARTVGVGLSAPTTPEKSGLATLLSGIGSGYAAASGAQTSEDRAAQARARADWEAEQQSILHRAQVGQNLALTARNWAEAQKIGADMDPQRQAGMALYKSATDAGISGAELIPFSEWQSRIQKNPKLQTEFHHFPAGFGAPEVDEASGTVKPGPGLVAIIPAHGDVANGTISLPQSYVDQISRYAALSGRFSKDDVAKIETGHEISLKQLAAIDNAVEFGRNEWLKGEMTPRLDWRNDEKGQPTIPILSNSINGDPVSYVKPGVTPGAAVEAVEKRKGEEAKIGLETEQAKEAQAKAKEALANADLAARSTGLGAGNIPTGDALNKLLGAYNNLPPDAKGFLQNITPDMQATVLSTWAGRTDPKGLPTAPRPKTGQLSRQQIESIITRFDPTWRENKFETVKKLEDDFINPKGTGGSIRSFGQFILHADQAAQTARSFQGTHSPLVNKPVNWLRQNFAGDPQVTKMITDLVAPLDEWQTFIKSGHAATAEEVSAKNVLLDENKSIDQKLAALQSMAHQGVSRLDEINETYRTVTGINYPNLVSPNVKTAGARLGLAKELEPYGSGGTVFTGASPLAQGSQSGQSQNAPAGASQEVYAADGKTLIGHVVNNKFVALGQ
jgi:hypothetical protein